MKRFFQKIFAGIWKRERGESMLIVAFALSGLLSVTALVTDLGVAYVATAEAQTAADAAVMAAGLLLPVSTSDNGAQAAAISTARQYLIKNEVENASSASITLGDASGGMYHAIEVRVPASSETAFARLFGVGQITFTREAEARIIPCAALSDVVPLSVEENTLKSLIASGATSHVVLKYGKNEEEVVQGAFGAVDLDGVNGGGANDYRNWLMNGYVGKLTIGTQLPVESGNMAGPTLTGVTVRYNACTHHRASGGCNASHYEAGCPRVMKVPVIEYTSSSHKHVRIKGFAAFVLEDYTTYASQGYVIGTYVDMVNIGAADGDLTGGSEDFGVYVLTLSK